MVAGIENGIPENQWPERNRFTRHPGMPVFIPVGDRDPEIGSFFTPHDLTLVVEEFQQIKFILMILLHGSVVIYDRTIAVVVPPW